MSRIPPATPVRYALVSLGPSSFRARIEIDQAPVSCEALIGLLPYCGRLLHARWSGEAVWSPLGKNWTSNSMLPEENATACPQPGQILLYTGLHSEPELLVPYGETRFAGNCGPLLGNPVLTIVERFDELARVGRSILENGASTLRIELVRDV